MSGFGLIELFARHRVLGNILMVLLLLFGWLGVTRMNVQFFPSFAVDVITVRVEWPGAAAEDVEQGITIPLEQRLKAVEGLKRYSSTSATGISNVSLEFRTGTDPVLALDEVRKEVDAFRNLPQSAERPVVSRVARNEPISRLLLLGGENHLELRQLARQFERGLLAAGINSVQLVGLPDLRLEVEIPGSQLRALELSTDGVARQLASRVQDLPSGILADADGARELRAAEQRRDPQAFADVPLLGSGPDRTTLGDVAELSLRPDPTGRLLRVEGRPAVELRLARSESGDSFKSAETLSRWLESSPGLLPPGVELRRHDETWTLIRDRIQLLVNNGLGGLVLVGMILYLLMPGRVALWVAVGIPTAFMAALGLLWAFGGSINMMSLFAFIMALGIIVDDAIVVGEDTYTHSERGESPVHAAIGATRRMLVPVMASMLTTLAAFLPLMLVGGVIGRILFDIPFVMLCVLIASLLECFLVLPAHLRNALSRRTGASTPGQDHGRLRERLDRGFDALRERGFRPLVRWALSNRFTMLATTAAIMILAIGLLAGGRVGFTFFPTPDGQVLYASVSFVSGTPRAQTEAFVAELERAALAAEDDLGGDLIQNLISHVGGAPDGETSNLSGDQFGGVMLELTPPDDRVVRNEQFLRAWRHSLRESPGVETLTLNARQSGPPGRDLNVRLTGDNPEQLKAAALVLAEALKGIPGVSAVTDDLPYGREQLIWRLTPAGEAMGLTTESLGLQLAAALDGALAQIYQSGPEEVEVRVGLPLAERTRLASLERLDVRLPDGRFAPLLSVAEFESRQGFEALRHADGRLAVEVAADVDAAVNKANRILAELKRDVLPQLTRSYGVQFSFEGRAADQRETMADMKTGLVLGLALIYLVLAAVFSHYLWPLMVMAAIPLGLGGALFGHWVMGLDLTLLSLFGLFGLSGIVVNNAIILTEFYRQLRQQGLGVRAALEEAACQRLRASLATTLTTIAGLMPLMFEQSLQAQFLIPMAVSLVFGLGFAVVQVLLVIPVLISFSERDHVPARASEALPDAV